jgi:hypothetical protein
MISLQDSRPARAKPQLGAETKAGTPEETRFQHLKREPLHEIDERVCPRRARSYSRFNGDRPRLVEGWMIRRLDA